jgi:hypothetical protein
VRGNSEAHHVKNFVPTLAGHVVTDADPSLIHNLRFGDGELLRDGTGDHQSGRSLKGRYIVRVGWDDVRGWFAEVRIVYGQKNIPIDFSSIGRNADWDGALEGIPHS